MQAIAQSLAAAAGYTASLASHTTLMIPRISAPISIPARHISIELIAPIHINRPKATHLIVTPGFPPSINPLPRKARLPYGVKPTKTHLAVKLKIAAMLPPITLIVLASSSALFASGFVAPGEGPVPFRRDQIPLEVSQITQLSRHLESLVLGLDPAIIEHRRAAAQMLALAMALEPANTSARELIADFQLGNSPPSAQEEEVPNARNSITETLAWLKSTEAGASANALGNCLQDVINISDSEPATTESGAWNQWVPALAAFKKQELPAEESLPTSAAPPVPIPVALPEAGLITVAWVRQQSPSKQQDLGPMLVQTILKMTAERSISQGTEPTRFSSEADLSLAQHPLGSMALLQTLLKSQHPELPADLEITFSLPDYLVEKMRPSPPISHLPPPALLPGTVDAAAATLANAAITGQAPSATIIGVLDERGTFLPGEYFWEQLAVLSTRQGTGKRLIIPTAAAPYLLGLLATEKSQFFLDYEVISASSFTELISRSGAEVTPSSAKFSEIRAKSLNQALGQYIANPFIRRRLTEIAVECPQHFSAKLLALQASGNRPAQVSREVLIPMLRGALQPIAPFVHASSSTVVADATPLVQLGEQCAATLAKVESYAAKADAPLCAKAQNVISAIRTIERAARNYRRDAAGIDALETVHSHFTRIYRSTLADLGMKLSDPDLPPATE